MQSLSRIFHLCKRYNTRILICTACITIIAYVYGLYQALVVSPPDDLQGEAVRIMYVHVPSAWMALGIYVMMAISNCFAIIYNSRLPDIVAYAAAPVGTCFAVICLITGSIWGKPIWGAWWVWDARLTSMLILFFLYVGYILLWNDDERSAKAAAILNILGIINIPIIKFSVEFWNTLHQPASIIRKGGIAVDTSMLVPLMLMFMAAIGTFIITWILRINTLLLYRKLYRLSLHD